MIKVFDKFETEFNNNGLQILDDYIIDPEVYEVLNGIYALTFKYPIFCTKHLEEENIIIAYTPKNEDQPFRISKVNKELGYYNVTAYHIFYDLSDNLIEDIFIVDNGGRNAIDKISEGSQYKHPFKMYSDIDAVNNCRIVRYNVVQALLDSSQDNTFISRWGGEIERDNYNITMRKRLGTNRGTQIRYKKNLIGYEADIDYTQVATRVMPKGYDGLLLPEKYVDSENIDYYPHPKIRIIEYGDIKAIKEDDENSSIDEGAVPIDEAYQLLREAAKREYEENHIDIPQANYKVDFVELSSTEEYKNIQVLEKVYLGDTVTVIHDDENLDITARVISYKYNPLNRNYTEIELGNYQKSFTDIVGKLNDLNGKFEDVEGSMLDLAKKNATELINNGFGGFVRIHPDRILIMDTEDEGTAKNVWQWNKNGLGYSSTGINGPYGLAMTNDGSIVADYITSGTLNANVITTGALKGKNFNLDLDSGLMEFGTGSITPETLTPELKEDLKGQDGKDGLQGPPGQKGKDGANGKDGQNGLNGTDAKLPQWWQDWNKTATTISGKWILTPQMYVGSSNRGVFFGDNVINGLSGLVGYNYGDVTFHLDTDGSLILGNKVGRQFIVDSSGDVTTPKLKVGEITTDILLPGTNRRIILEPGYDPGDNNCMSIDSNRYAIRLKFDEDNYVFVGNREIRFFISGSAETVIDDYGLKTDRLHTESLESSGSEPIVMHSSINGNGMNLGQASSKFNQVSARSVWGDNGSVSDIKFKENIHYLSKPKIRLMRSASFADKDVIKPNENNDINLGMTPDDLHNFIKNDLKLCEYNYNDEYYGGCTDNNFRNKLGFVAQDISDTLVGSIIVGENEGSLAYNLNNYASVIAGALQVEIMKSEEKNIKIKELETRLEKIEKLLNL
ncbi:phage tail spike protein [Metaclostridioides mangenotii]|uniref:phage tail spike protein n=1 Tax=Metaclostridioides mangenotii TaxID=1540 RepID=UPI0026F0954F|nr:phage tail spike protein [Clostridioides mangenotii]